MEEKKYMEFVDVDPDKLRAQVARLGIVHKEISLKISASPHTIKNAIYSRRMRYGIAKELETTYGVLMESYVIPEKPEKPEGLFAEQAAPATPEAEQLALLRSINDKLVVLVEAVDAFRNGELSSILYGAINGAAIKAERDGRGWGIWQKED